MLDFDVKIHKKGDGTFQTKFLDPKTGKRKRKVFETLKDAKIYKNDIVLRIQNKGTSALGDARISQAVKMYLEHFPYANIKNKKNHFASFIDKFSAYRVSEVSQNDLKIWLDSTKKKGNLSDKTLNNIKSQFFGFFEYLVTEDLLKQNPLIKIKFKRHDVPRRARVILSPEEIKEILENVKKMDDELFSYLYTIVHTGARRGEIARLTKEDVDFKTGLLHLKQTKNGHERFIKMSPNLIIELKRVVQSCNSLSLFPSFTCKSVIGKAMVKFKAHFPIDKDWGCHSLRHSFAYNFLKASGEMYQLQAILGHKGIQVTVDLYGQLKAQDIENPSPYNF
jgi:integrase